MACTSPDQLLFDWAPSGRAVGEIAAPSTLQPPPSLAGFAYGCNNS